MGYGQVVNGRHKPITPYRGSWATVVNTKLVIKPNTPTQTSTAIAHEQKLEDQKILKDAEYYLGNCY